VFVSANVDAARPRPARTSTSTAAAASSPAAAPSSSRAAPPDAIEPLDVTAETAADTESLADTIARRAEMMVVKQNEADQESQLRIDRMRAEFDDAQAERAELLREMNVLRDMAIEQQKHDDEILTKWIALR
jgi:hypothetical protein